MNTGYASQLADNAAKGPFDEECEECGHLILRHGKDGCEVELGDAWVTGSQPDQPTVLVAQGPCGCQAYTLEIEEDGDA